MGHGTQVAGVAGAVGNNGKGVTGVAWGVRLMACRFFDDDGMGSISDAVECIDYARQHGAHVINASFVSSGYSSSLYNAINACRSAGIIFVAAAGNDSIDNDASPQYPASYDLDNIVAVAATTRTDGLASYSNHGATSVDLGAPGSSLTTTYHNGDSSYVLNSGTSFSAPVVAGAFALMRQRYSGEGYRQMIDRVLAATDPLTALEGKTVSGGRLNLYQALGPSVLADFTASPTVGEVPLPVQFTDGSFGEVTSWAWEFGDGATSTEQNPAHTYSNEGNFAVTLTVTTDSGATSTKQRTVSTVANYEISPGTYSWIDPSSMTALNLADNGVSALQPLPFAFVFYGQTYEGVYVGANGLIGFSAAGLEQSFELARSGRRRTGRWWCRGWACRITRNRPPVTRSRFVLMRRPTGSGFSIRMFSRGAAMPPAKGGVPASALNIPAAWWRRSIPTMAAPCWQTARRSSSRRPRAACCPSLPRRRSASAVT
jgi:PKD repeat protein